MILLSTGYTICLIMNTNIIKNNFKKIYSNILFKY